MFEISESYILISNTTRASQKFSKKAMRTFKHYFAVILGGLRPYFPLRFWCKMLNQAETTLNMMRPCSSNPKFSSYQSLEGEFSCNYALLAPLGAKTIAHDQPTNRQMWASHGHFG